MNFPTTPLVIKLIAFSAAILPLLIGNIRYKKVSNRNNFILFAAGVAWVVVERSSGWSNQPLSDVFLWIGGAIVAGVAIATIFGFPAGVAKTLIALSPWFPIEKYLLVVVLGLVPAALICRMLRKSEFQVVLPLTLACFAVWLF